MNFSDFIDLDVSSNSLLLKQYNNNISSVIKIDNKEIEEIKIKKDSITFFTISKKLNNPIKPEFTILIYTINNHIIELIYEYEDKKVLEELEEFVKSILL